MNGTSGQEFLDLGTGVTGPDLCYIAYCIEEEENIRTKYFSGEENIRTKYFTGEEKNQPTPNITTSLRITKAQICCMSL